MKRNGRKLFWIGAALACAALSACSRNRGDVPLVAPHDDGKLGTLHTEWDNTGEERGFAGGDRLAEPEVRFRFRVDARNRGDDKIFLRLHAPELVDDANLSLGAASADLECTLGAGESRGLLSGEIWVPKSKAKRARAVRVAHVAVPLGEKALKRYRDWLLQGRPNDAAQIDAEIAAYAAKPPCAGK